MESILTSVKKLNNVPEECESFDADFISYINGVFMDLREMGVGPSAGFMIFDKSTVWTDFVRDLARVVAVISYTGLRVKLLFDPPTSPSHLEAINNQIAKYEWMINHAAEQGPSEDSLIIAELTDEISELKNHIKDLESSSGDGAVLSPLINEIIELQNSYIERGDKV